MKIPMVERIVGLSLAAVLAGGCDSFLDVNEDPNAPVNARVDVRFPGLVTGVVHSVYSGDPSLWSVEWMHQTAYNQLTRNYDEIHRYEVQDNSPSEWWSYYYAEILNESKLMMAQTDPQTDAAYHGLSKFLWAWTWALTTDFWGPIPFTDALDPTIPTPGYDDQSVVYDAVDAWFDESIADMQRAVGDGSIRRPGAGDLLYGGDIGQWIRLARVVQARHRLRLVNAPWTSPAQQAQAALDALGQGFTSNADDADFIYTGGEDARNPLWVFQDRGDLFKASAFVVGLLEERSDPRLPIMVMPALTDGAYRGLPNAGSPRPDSTISRVGLYFTAEDATINVASYADMKFTEAEARLIVGGAAAADAPYRAGIRANMEKWGVAEADIAAYLAARPPLTAVADPLAEVIREKYIANYLKVEPWNDWRRTGYPAIQPVPDGVLADIPVRIRTPADELANNGANVLATGISAGLDGMLYAGPDVWWAGN